LRSQLESAVLQGRHAAEAGVRAALASLGVEERDKPAHLSDEQARLRRGLRAKQRQLGGEFDVLIWDAAYEQWHRLLFARFLAENELLLHPEYGAPVTLEECEELAEDLSEPDGWSVAAWFASEILPGIFRLDDPCVKLRLAPEHRIGLERIVAGLPDEVFRADDSLGWVYQYWQSERKDEVNASEKKIGGADLGPVTQLFTEKYMVRFLLENSLGAWWAARHPDSPLVEEFDYLRFDDEGQPAAGAFQEWPQRVAEVTVMDPCCGSGHFLVEAFEMLWRMRVEEEGLDPITAQDAVLRDNLFGLELDPRCVQIAMFAVALTAWKQGGGWRALPTPTIACSGIPAKAPLEEWTALAEGDTRLERALERLHHLFKDADTLGSLIDPRRAAESANGEGSQRSLDDVDFAEVAPLLEQAAARETNDPATAVLGAYAAGIARAANILGARYSLVATNPPYLTRQKQTIRLRNHLEARFKGVADLATTFVEYCLKEMCVGGGAVSLVTPLGWFFQPAYRDMRRDLLANTTWEFIVRLGPGAFRAVGGEIVSTALVLLSKSDPAEHVVPFLDAFDSEGVGAKTDMLIRGRIGHVTQAKILENPDSRVVLFEGALAPGLSRHAHSRTGTRTGDNPQLLHFFWEHQDLSDWRRVQSVPDSSKEYSGREKVLYWEADSGATMRYLAGIGQASIQGMDAWSKRGVCLGLTGAIKATLYTGELFDMNVGVVWPKRASDLPALWSYLADPTYSIEVRRLDQQLKLTTRTLVQVPFDVDRWRQVAAEQYPDGLPEPWSDDPTQWLFAGRPEEATEPLQVGVGRLVGYRWPEQVESDDLDELADDDGIVCLPAVAGESPAADRLQALLARAYGHGWSPGLVRQLIEQIDSKKKNLADWLRDDFFKQHCKVFSNRPFVWHIWDGRNDGFSALVNYQRLDRSGLEKLTYTYLGDWIERQRADAAEEVAGADVRLAAARELKEKLQAILGGEPPYDIYVRWKELHEQPIGWEPDLDDGVRLNVRPFVKAGVLRSRFTVHWRKDRGKNPDGSERHNDLHFSVAQKQQARQGAGRA
jgi:hypothetical protein